MDETPVGEGGSSAVLMGAGAVEKETVGAPTEEPSSTAPDATAVAGKDAAEGPSKGASASSADEAVVAEKEKETEALPKEGPRAKDGDDARRRGSRTAPPLGLERRRRRGRAPGPRQKRGPGKRVPCCL